MGHKITSGVNGDGGDLILKSNVNVRDNVLCRLGYRVKQVKKIGPKFKVPVFKRLGPKAITNVQGKRVGFKPMKEMDPANPTVLAIFSSLGRSLAGRNSGSGQINGSGSYRN